MERSKSWAGLLGIVLLVFAVIGYVTGARFYFLLNLALSGYESRMNVETAPITPGAKRKCR